MLTHHCLPKHAETLYCEEMQPWQILGIIVVDSAHQAKPNLLCVTVTDGKTCRRENVSFKAAHSCGAEGVYSVSR